MKHAFRRVLFTAAVLAGTFNISTAYNGSGTITSGGKSRSFSFYAPGAAVAQNLPVLFVLHGDGETGATMASLGFNTVADNNNFIVVYPNALNSAWNRYADDAAGDAGLGNPDAPDDVQFISDMIDYFCSEYRINAQKVYATGHSAGGFMCYNLAVQLQSRIAAIAPVAGSLWGDDTFLSTHISAIPVYHIHGDADMVVNYPDPDFQPGAWEEWPLAAFANAACGNNTYTGTTAIVSGVTKLNFCTGAKEVSLIRVAGLGHSWPNVSGYNAALAIWNFCSSYSLSSAPSCAVTAVAKVNKQDIMISPNPASGFFTIQAPGSLASVKLLDGLGKEIALVPQGNAAYSCPAGLPGGIYFVKVLTVDGVAYTEKLLFQ